MLLAAALGNVEDTCMFRTSEHSWRNPLRGFSLPGLRGWSNPYLWSCSHAWPRLHEPLPGHRLDSQAYGPVHGDPQNGKRLYDRYGCYQCHGRSGQGSIRTGPRSTDATGFPSCEIHPATRWRDASYTQQDLSQTRTDASIRSLQSLPRRQSAKKIPLLT